MDDQQPPSRRYDEKEMRALIRRASELQAAHELPGGESVGLSLAEVQAIAADLGIETRHLYAAAAELDSEHPRAEMFRLLRLPRTVRLERSVPGRIQEEAWPDAVQAIRETFRGVGQVTRLGPAHEWSSRLEVASVTVTPQKESSRIGIAFHYGPAVYATMILVAFYSLVGAGATMENLDWSPALEWLASGGGIAGALAAARQVLSVVIGRHRRKLDRLAYRLQQIVERNAATAPSRHTASSPVAEDTELLSAAPPQEDHVHGPISGVRRRSM